MTPRSVLILCGGLAASDTEALSLALDEVTSVKARLSSEASAHAILRRLAEGSSDFLVLGGRLCSEPGLDLVSKLREEGHILPVLFLASRDERGFVLRGLAAGVDGCIARDELNGPTLLRALNGAAVQHIQRRDDILFRLASGMPEERDAV
jgi:DNA-binding NarL/FixJ family response regulator